MSRSPRPILISIPIAHPFARLSACRANRDTAHA